MNTRRSGLIALCLTFACGGAEDAEPTGDADGTEDLGPTWHADVAPIVIESCGSCHYTGGPAPFELDQYATASSLSEAMIAAIDGGTMPPFMARETDECTPKRPWKDDIRLTDDEIETLRAWVEAGAPEGDAADAAAIAEPPPLEIADPDLELEMPTTWSVSGTEDQFICFVVDPGVSENTWVSDLQFLPGNPKIDHHALIYHDIYGASEELKNPDGTYPCFGDADVDAVLMATWTPGAKPMGTPEGAGMPLFPTSRIVVQMHYHPTGEGTELDLSALQMKFTDEEPQWEAAQALLGNNGRLYSDGTGLQPGPNDPGDEPEFLIPAGVPDHVETMLYEQEIDFDFPVYSVGTHMHYVGTDMKVDLVHATPDPDGDTEECLIQTPNWDFSWQRVYDYDVPVEDLPVVSKGDQIWMRCTYDNSLDNPYVRQALAEQGLEEPHDVYLGDETLDEMCLSLVGIVTPIGFLDILY